MRYVDAHAGEGPLPPRSRGESPPDLTGLLREQRRYHALLNWQRTAGFWWPRLLLVLLGGCAAGILGYFLPLYPKDVLGGIGGIALVIWAARRLEIGLILLCFFASPFVPKAFSLHSLDVYPVELLLVLLAGVVLVQAAFRVRRFVWPSLAVSWPLLGLILLALASSVLIQLTWIPQVPHRLNTGALIYSEIIGVVMYCVPLVVIVVTMACLTAREQWIVHVSQAVLVLGLLAAAVILIEFKHVGADVYAFRYKEENILYGQPAILFMSLGDLAQWAGLGAIVAYAHLLHADRWRGRALFGGLLLLYLGALYVTVENSRWLEVAVALVVITIVYSRRLFVLGCVLCLPFLPLAHALFVKLQSVKAGDVYRIIIWQDFIRIWLKRPVLGVGPGNAWSYDQVFTHLPLLLNDFDKTGLGIAHDGTLQILAEVGPLGVICLYAFVIITIVAAVRLYRRSTTPDQRPHRLLGLICLGLVCGAVAGDIFSGDMLLPPGQTGGFNDLPHIVITWILFGCLLYTDQRWRSAHKTREATGSEREDARSIASDVPARVPTPA